MTTLRIIFFVFSNRTFSPPKGLCAYQGLLWSGSLCYLWLRWCEQSCALVPICQTSQSASKRVLTWNISFIPGPFIGNQRPGDLLIRVLCWSLFSERGAGELSAGNAKICNRTDKDNSKREATGWGRGQGQPGGSLVAWTALHFRSSPHDLVMAGISHNGSRQHLLCLVASLPLVPPRKLIYSYWEIYFKEWAHEIVESGESKICRAGQQAR